MAGNYKLISQISPGQTNWTAKVVVAEKSVPKIGQHSPTKYQNIVLIDLEGNKVQATIYDNNITAFQNKRLLSKTYLVSNATVKHTKAQYRSVAGDIQWTITGRTRIEEIQENHATLLYSTYQFVPFDKLQKHMDSNSEICILAIAIDMRPKRQIQTLCGGQSTVQEIILINNRFETAVLRMWDNFVDNECNTITSILNKKPVILGKHLKVTSFNGLSISTKGNSSILIDPQFDQVLQLKSWIDNHMERLDAIISKKSYLRFSSSNLLAPAEDKYTKIQSIQDLLFVQKFFWVKATVSIIRPLRQSLWYMACNNCNKVASVNFNEVYECIYCKCPQARATTRARAYVELRDLTGSINAAIIGEPAEKFLQCTADKLMQEDANPDILQVVRTTTGEDYILYVKALNNDPSVGQIKYEVVFILHPVSVQEMPTNTERNSLENLLTTSKEIPNEENSKSVTIPVRRALILPQIKFDQNQKDKQKMYEDDDVFLHPFAETEIQTPAQTNKYDDFSDHEPCPKC